MSSDYDNEYETRRALSPETRGGDKPEDITGLPEALGPARAPADPAEQVKWGIEYIQKTYGDHDDDDDGDE